MQSRLLRSPKRLSITLAAVMLLAGTAVTAPQMLTTRKSAKTAASAATYTTLAGAFNNTAVSDDGAPTAANFDKAGASFSAQDLAAYGWGPGQAITYAGTKLTWPNVAAGKPNNVVAASQVITLSGKGKNLTFVTAADHGPSTGTGKITYSDGTTSSYTLTAPDWVGGNPAQALINLPHRNSSSGQQAGPAQLFTVNIPLNTSKTVSSVTLPGTPTVGRIHIFALSIRPITTGWTATWGTATERAMAVGPWTNETLRMVVRSSVGGTSARVRFENTYNTAPVTIGHATIAVQQDGWTPKATPVTVTFGGNKSVTIPAGGEAISDAATISIPANSRLLVSEYFPGSITAATVHMNALETNYNAFAGAGDHTADLANYPLSNTFAFTTFLAGVDVSSSAGAVVALGDSITDGIGAGWDTDTRWPDYLSNRLGGTRGVVNEGIAGNQILTDLVNGGGMAATNRQFRDVIGIPGVKSLVLHEGTNDINAGASAAAVEAGLKQIVSLAHTYGIKVYISPITPASNYTADKQAVRSAVNSWIYAGSSGADGLADFRVAITVGGNPEAMYSIYDSGDHLHPNSAGYNSMANIIDVTKL